MICPKCGADNPDQVKFCGNCGTKLEQQSVQQTPPQAERIYIQQPVTEETLPAQFRPLSPWAYFGYSLLFSIPVVGFILLIVFSCKKSNINRRNFARAYWCGLILCLIIVATVLIVAATTVGLGAFFDKLR